MADQVDSKTLAENFRLVEETIKAYPLQLKQAWDEISKVYIPDYFKDVDNIVFSAMGGSALGARMVDYLAFSDLNVPLEIFNGYKLPGYVNEKTLVITCSYSGTTEETIESTFQAMKKHAKVFAITTGGKLADMVKENNISSYVFDPLNNPSKQPRMSIGYAVGAVLGLFTKLGFIHVTNEEIDEAVKIMNETCTDLGDSIDEDKNLAKKYAKTLVNKIPVLVASEHLVGATYTIKNQFNESAKTFCDLFELPELNHHLMEGLKHPGKNTELLHFVFVSSNLYTQRVQKRYPLTCEVVEKNGVGYSVYSPHSSSKIAQMFEVLTFGSFVVYYLTKHYNIDPTAIPWVDYFKAKLKSI